MCKDPHSSLDAIWPDAVDNWREETEDRDRMLSGVRLRLLDATRFHQPLTNIEGRHENPLG
jgi:hypothetical protein